MKIHLLSDVHLERSTYVPPQNDFDVVILAGDIGVGTQGVEWAQLNFPNATVIYVPGNHEYHHEFKSVSQLFAEMQAVANSKMHVMDRGELILGNYRFLGATLWSDFAIEGEAWTSIAMSEASRRIEDFSRIWAENGVLLTPKLARDWHLRDRAWLSFKLKEPFHGETIVITHFGSASQSLSRLFRHQLTNGWFASDLSSEMGRCSYWCHGHVHHSVEDTVEGTVLLANPKGDNNALFNPRLIFS